LFLAEPSTYKTDRLTYISQSVTAEEGQYQAGVQ